MHWKKDWIAKALVLALAFSIFGQGPAAADSGKAQQVIDSQINAFRSGQHEEAFSYASPNLRKFFGSTERFIEMVRGGYGAIYGARNWSFGRSRLDERTLYQEVLLTGPKGGNWVALYSLQQQADGSWKITAVHMRKAQAQST